MAIRPPPVGKGACHMNLHRLADAIRTQNWFTVFIEFVIVVADVFVGLHVDGLIE
jgi:hypothetical protein